MPPFPLVLGDVERTSHGNMLMQWTCGGLHSFDALRYHWKLCKEDAKQSSSAHNDEAPCESANSAVFMKPHMHVGTISEQCLRPWARYSSFSCESTSWWNKNDDFTHQCTALRPLRCLTPTGRLRTSPGLYDPSVRYHHRITTLMLPAKPVFRV